SGEEDYDSCEDGFHRSSPCVKSITDHSTGELAPERSARCRSDAGSRGWYHSRMATGATATKKRKASRYSGKERRLRKRGPTELVIITGMSGSGKGSVLRAFEDLGYYCVDNLPLELIPRFAELARQSPEIERTALVVDVREGQALTKLPRILKQVRNNISTQMVFLDSTDESLVRRFSETRR